MRSATRERLALCSHIANATPAPVRYDPRFFVKGRVTFLTGSLPTDRVTGVQMAAASMLQRVSRDGEVIWRRDPGTPPQQMPVAPLVSEAELKSRTNQSASGASDRRGAT